MNDFSKDIPLDLATAAHSGTSFVPEDRGQSEVKGYGDDLAQYLARFTEHATKGGTLDKLPDEFARFRAGVAKRTRAYLESRTRFVSAFIVGPSKYPAARMQKRHGVIERRLDDLLEFKERASRAVIRNLRPDLAPIRASDADALERLGVEIRTLEARQARMKSANAAIRKTAGQPYEARVFALCALGFSPAMADRLLKPGRLPGSSIGFASFELTNNGANIRRIKARMEQISQLRTREAKETTSADGVRLEEAPSENRVRLYYQGKPAPDVIANLKRNGFRWSPSLGCWSAYYNKLLTARAFAGIATREG